MRCCKFSVDLGDGSVAVVGVLQKLVVAGSAVDFASFEKFTKACNAASIERVFPGAEVGEAVGGNVRISGERVVGKAFDEFLEAGRVVFEGRPAGRVFQISLKPDGVLVVGSVGSSEKVFPIDF